ncbi:Endonuclease, Uma2 family (restriction endonuclease fold) [Prosthecobacter debontii]|uniref:Endonuclease, Uma2 family (Restriction endonuclease fold) n=1 Tax=Prosthecobacter debontii TaxID=48467 RepID=A0A1T4YLM7_9BACT|nr:Uma2 family endonuclease [Prosthecobacter debontii]SKB02737.1 Endonuclease, Uma2 family (restriction endonuclease fold) [Prosthecobacter debontii]
MSTAILEDPAPLSYEEERGKPMPSFHHGIVQANLIVEFAKRSDYRCVSEVAVIVESVSYTPDICLYPRKQVDFRHDTVRMKEPPVVAVEIFSPSQGSLEIMEKVDTYLQAGVKSVWVVAPPLTSITIYTADGKQKGFLEGTVTDPATGIQVEMDQVFR